MIKKIKNNTLYVFHVEAGYIHAFTEVILDLKEGESEKLKKHCTITNVDQVEKLVSKEEIKASAVSEKEELPTEEKFVKDVVTTKPDKRSVKTAKRRSRYKNKTKRGE